MGRKVPEEIKQVPPPAHVSAIRRCGAGVAGEAELPHYYPWNYMLLSYTRESGYMESLFRCKQEGLLRCFSMNCNGAVLPRLPLPYWIMEQNHVPAHALPDQLPGFTWPYCALCCCLSPNPFFLKIAILLQIYTHTGPKIICTCVLYNSIFFFLIIPGHAF